MYDGEEINFTFLSHPLSFFIQKPSNTPHITMDGGASFSIFTTLYHQFLYFIFCTQSIIVQGNIEYEFPSPHFIFLVDFPLSQEIETSFCV